MEKKQLRKELRKNRALRYTPQSWANLAQCPELISARTIATYISYEVEPSTVELNAALLAQGKTLVVPKMLEDRDLRWIQFDSDLEVADETEIDAVIVPALAVDHSGIRMGQGGGSYDRTLPRLDAWKVALVYEDELLASLPHESHDIPVDAVATPSELIRFNR